MIEVGALNLSKTLRRLDITLFPHKRLDSAWFVEVLYRMLRPKGAREFTPHKRAVVGTLGEENVVSRYVQACNDCGITYTICGLKGHAIYVMRRLFGKDGLPLDSTWLAQYE